MKIIFQVSFLIILLFDTSAFGNDFSMEIHRDTLNDNLVEGTIYINGKKIGKTYERYDLKVNRGTYNGSLKYVSYNGHATGPFGTIGNSGDFLLEIDNVKWSDNVPRTNLLFHGGNKPEHSRGCIMIGGVPRDNNNIRYLPKWHTLRKLRNEFYGTELPVSCPNKNITIEINEFNPKLIGTFAGDTVLNYGCSVEFKIENDSITGKLTINHEGTLYEEKLNEVKMISPYELITSFGVFKIDKNNEELMFLESGDDQNLSFRKTCFTPPKNLKFH